MRNAFLTIDDSPSSLTTDLLSFVQERSIECVFFCIGSQLLRYPEQADRIVRAGYPMGNHSFSHTAFSKLTLKEACEEIATTERLIDEVYARNALIRGQKYFRFPYGDKGGPRKDAIQQVLVDHSFQRLSGLNITYPWYSEHALNIDHDLFWTFDTRDYRLSDGVSNEMPQDLLNHIDELDPPLGGSLSVGDSDEIVLMHDNPSTNERFPRYYVSLIERIEGKGVSFVRRAV